MIKRKISRFEVDLITEEIRDEKIHTMAISPRILDTNYFGKVITKEDFEDTKALFLARILAPDEFIISARAEKIKEFEEVV